jgi:hypothetical protein
MQTNEITEDQVLRGEAVIKVEKRDGSQCNVKCKALNWAATCNVASNPNPGETMVFTVLSGTEIKGDKDEFLNALTPTALSEIAGTVLLLTNGLPGLKKAQAARNQGAQPATPTSTPSPVSSAPMVLPAPNAPDSVQPS